MTHKSMQIVSGPSKFDFLQTLAFRRHPVQKVIFKIIVKGQKIEAECEISTITAYNDQEYTGDEGHGWFFLGFLRIVESNQVTFVRGKYSTMSRDGWVEAIPTETIRTIDKLLQGK